MIEIILTVITIAAAYFLGNNNGKKAEEVKSQEAYLNAVQEARTVRNRLNDPEYVNSLWSKYKK